MTLNFTKRYTFHSFAKHIEFFSITALILFLPLCFFSQMAFPYHSPKSVFLGFFVVTILCLSLLRIANKREFIFQTNAIDFSIILRLLVLILLYLFIPRYGNGFESIKLLVLLTTFYFLVQYVLTNELLDVERSILFIGKSLILSSVIEIILVTKGLIETPIITSAQLSYNKPLIFGTFGNPNSVAVFLSACFPFFLFFIRQTHSKFWKTVTGITGLWVFIVIMLTKSRASWIALCVGVAVFYFPGIVRFIKAIRRKTLLMLAVILSIVFCFTMIQLINMNQESVKGRILVWQVAYDMIKNSPIIGIGYGNFAVQYLDYQGNFLTQAENHFYLNNAGDLKQAHNEYIEVFAETGLIGLVFFAFIIHNFIFTGIKLLKEKSVGTLSVKTYYSSGIVILVHSLFDSPLHVLPMYLMFFLNCSIVSFYSKREMVENKSNHYKQGFVQRSLFLFKKNYTYKINMLTWIFLLCIAIFLFFLNGFYTVTRINGYRSWQKGINCAMNEQWGEALINYESAKANFPNDGRLFFNIGAAYLNDGKPLDAIPYLEQSLISFQDKNIFVLLGFAYTESHQHRKAERTLQELNYKFPNLLLPHLLLGKLYFDNGRIEESKQQLELVLNTTPKLNNEFAEKIKGEAKYLLKEIK